MKLYPLFADLKGLPVLVVGGGTVAARKVAALLDAGAQVRLGAPQLDSGLMQWVEEGRLRWMAGAYMPAWLDDVWLVIAATDDRALNAQIAAEAGERRIFVNVVDDAAQSRFHVPAVIDRAPLTIAISTAGAAPALASRLRETLEQVVDHAYGSLVTLAQHHRRHIVGRFPDLAARRGFYRWLHDGPVFSLLRHARPADAERCLTEALRADKVGPAKGSVALVGAGPGHPELLTLQALRALNQADVILHDQLVSADILAMARRDAERIDVGKRCGGHQVAQAHIHQLMLMHARAGQRVVRLKGGDPFVFGRGGEELTYLHAHGIDCEIVPGITAAVACAAFAGVPLTHREHAHSVCLLTAHGRDGIDRLDAGILANHRQTLAVYMGVEKIGALTSRLLAHGRRADTPFALVENGTMPQQRVVAGVLRDLPALARSHAVTTPALLIIGEVAGLAKDHACFGQLLTVQQETTRRAAHKPRA
ncbi:MAG: uroporphyrinogen-III C-methyltransferase [Rhodanobacter sp.]|nr:MAG: uroporphyrinogen-III C-methyltransferase [Rhodanobacter sp.]TAM03692.1 MAG: uroporphyrinogen-III C-methyltransferase [Rhodanobacter sp.]TAM40156.1 MAG: uroporphyrinogen-III C-methyltransferase [Rhodanobacter sp.]